MNSLPISLALKQRLGRGNLEMACMTFYASWNNCWGGGGGGGILLGILGWVVPPGSPNPDPISDQNMSFSKPIFRPHAVTYKFHARFQTKKSQKPYPLFGAAHNYIAYIRECPPGIIATFKKRDSDREVPVPS